MNDETSPLLQISWIMSTTTTRRNENDDYASIASTAISSSENTNATVKENVVENDYLVMDIDEAIDRLGMGLFQIQIVLACGLCFASDAMEYLLLSYLAVILKSQWDLSEGQSDFISSVVFLGALCGTLLLTPLGDKLGRRIIFAVTSCTISIFGVLSAFCTSYKQILMVRFLVGFGIGGLTVPYDTLGEFMPNSRRGKNMLSTSFFWISASLLVPLVAWLTVDTNSWRAFVMLCSVPSILSTFLGIWLVPESPRWLVTRGKHERALQILRQAAAKNGQDPFLAFPDGVRLVDHTNDDSDESDNDGIHRLPTKSQIQQDPSKLQIDSSMTSARDQSCLMCSSPQWRKMSCLLGVQWYGLTFMYYGAIIAVSIVFSNTQDNENENNDEAKLDFDYVALLISSSAEIVGLTLAILLVDWLGRVPTQVWGYTGGGVCLLLLGILDFYLPRKQYLIAFAFLSRMFIMGATAVTWLHTAELLPTRFRATGHGLANALGRVGGMTCPFIVSRDNSLRTIGLVMVSVGIVTAMSVYQLPETAGKALGDLRSGRQDPVSLPASNDAIEDVAEDDSFEDIQDATEEEEEADKRMVASFEIL